MARPIDKIIVTHGGALRAKYGAGFKAVQAALKARVAADQNGGLRTRIIELDDAKAMKALGATPVTKQSDPRQHKRAIDGICAALEPAYLLILGATDVVPHQDLKNPLFDPADDEDEYALGDLPYVCEADYSQKPEAFRSPTRVVGRLPDLVGAQDSAYVVGLLDTAAKARSRAPAEYAAYLGVSAEVWQASTELSLQNLFGSKAKPRLSPPSGPRWSAARLAARCHFFNCHGAPADPQFYGQRGNKYPVAHSAARVAGKIANGTVLSAECCYGAELYDPALAAGQAGLCNTYLASGAYAVFGSSTIAYGPSSGNGSADLICQFFLKHVLRGASVGRAALQARQDFVRAASPLDPFDLKTLAQFSLMGDPSIQPVQLAAAPKTSKSRAGGTLPEASPEAARALRRRKLRIQGLALGQAAAHVETTTQGRTSAKMRDLLTRAARKSGIRTKRFASFGVAEGGAALYAKSKGAFVRLADRQGPSKVHVAIGKVSGKAAKAAPFRGLQAIVATEWNGNVTFRQVVSR